MISGSIHAQRSGCRRQDYPPLTQLTFRTEAAESQTHQETQFTAVLGFNYLHLVRDLPGTMRRIHDMLEPGGLFIANPKKDKPLLCPGS